MHEQKQFVSVFFLQILEHKRHVFRKQRQAVISIIVFVSFFRKQEARIKNTAQAMISMSDRWEGGKEVPSGSLMQEKGW